MKAIREFPWAEFNGMLFALLRHAEHLDSRLHGRERDLELIRILTLLQQAVPRPALCAPWKDARVVHSLLVECIQRQRGNRNFADDIALMKSAANAYVHGARVPSTRH